VISFWYYPWCKKDLEITSSAEVVKLAVSQVRIFVYGRVQGVGYRHSLSRTATEHGVGGWVRNRPDGSVEILLQGKREVLEKMIQWCKKGPSFAMVSDHEISWEDPERIYGTFDIVF